MTSYIDVMYNYIFIIFHSIYSFPYYRLAELYHKQRYSVTAAHQGVKFDFCELQLFGILLETVWTSTCKHHFYEGNMFHIYSNVTSEYKATLNKEVRVLIKKGHEYFLHYFKSFRQRQAKQNFWHSRIYLPPSAEHKWSAYRIPF